MRPWRSSATRCLACASFRPNEMAALLDYSPTVLDLFVRRPFAGRMLPAPDIVSGQAGEKARGAQVQFWLKCAGPRIQAISFLAYGCPHTVAAASWWAQRVQGLSLNDAKQAGWREAEQALSIPVEKRGRLLVVEDALRAALQAAA